MVDKQKILGIGLLLTGLLVLGNITGLLSATGDFRPEFDECKTNEDGDIESCNAPPSTEDRIQDLGAFYEKDAEFRIKIDGVGGGEPVYARHAEIKGGFDDWRNVDSSYLDSIKEHSTCTLNADLGFDQAGKVDTSAGKVRFTNQPDDLGEVDASLFMTRSVSVTTDVVSINGGGDMFCKFNVSSFVGGDAFYGHPDDRDASFFRQDGGHSPIIESGGVKVDFDTGGSTSGGTGSGGSGGTGADGGSSQELVLFEKLVRFLGRATGITYYASYTGGPLFQF